jgi:hypothetical protein
MYTQQQIKDLLDSGALPIDQNNIIKKGVLSKSDDTQVPYDLYCGWDFALARSCDREWGRFNLELMQFIENQQYNEENLKKVLSEVQLDDAHWDWLGKSAAYHSKEYVWFFIVAEGRPQGACLIFHPQKSAIAHDDIFYIEYVAVAPWNRRNPISERAFCGVGGLLIRSAIQHATEALKLRHGFCLHSLSKAAEFYKKIGMVPYPAHDKPHLQYFEMDNAATVNYLVMQ